MFHAIRIFLFCSVVIVLTQSMPNTESVTLINGSSKSSGTFAANSTTRLTPPIIPSETYKEQINSDTLNCGGTLVVSTAIDLYLQYKPFETASTNERCVWIIRATNATYAQVRVEYFGNPQSPRGSLSVLGLGTDGQQNYIEPSYAYQILNGTSVIVVTFATSTDTNGRGFALAYFFGNNGGHHASSSSSERLLDGVLGFFKHPSNGGTYSTYEVSVTAFVPPITCRADERVRLMIQPLGLEDYYDYITVFEFLENKWIETGRFYAWFKQQVIRSQDMVLLVFTSSGYYNYEGFEITYAIC